MKDKKDEGIRSKAITIIACLLTGLFTFPSVHAATYYVSTAAGDDSYSAAQAQNVNTPWKTIQKAADNMVAGDVCLIKAGTYRETVTPANSGATSLPITFQEYGDGDVIISGTEILPVAGQGWTLENSNLYYTPMTWTLSNSNQIFQNFTMRPLARWPNNSDVWQGSRPATPSSNTYTDTWSYIDSAGYDAGGLNGWIIDAALPSINWTGCSIHILPGHGWAMEHSTVTSYDNTAHKLTTDNGNGNETYHAFKTGNEYYITGSKELLDSHGEWFYDSSNSRLYFYSSSGSPFGIEAKKRSYGFDICGKSYINLVGLHFFACTIKTDASSTDCEFDSLHMQYLNHSSVISSFWGLRLYDRCVLRNSELAFDSKGLIYIDGDDVAVINNYFHDSGYLPDWTAAIDSYIIRRRAFISHNTMHDSGRALLGFMGKKGIFEYNNMYNAMKLTTDGGLVYVYREGENNIVRYNLMHDSWGPEGHSGASVMGFYLDSFNCGWIAHHNIIWNIPSSGIQMNNTHGCSFIFNNTCWNTDYLRLYNTTDDPLAGLGVNIFNNLLMDRISVNYSTGVDVRYNLYSDPLFVAPENSNFQLQAVSPAIDNGIVIPGVTDNYVGTAPDMGALEYGGVNWTSFCGHNFTAPPSPEPAYDFPDMIFCNKIIDGSFENNSFSPNWTVEGDVSLCCIVGHSGSYLAQFTGNDARISQTLNDLQPGRRYMLLASVRKTNATDSMVIGVQNYGRSTVEATVDANDTSWHTYALPFITGLLSTSAQIYIQATNVANAIDVDDVGVELYTYTYDVPSLPTVYYRFNETSGLTAYDSSSSSLDGVLYNMTSTDWVEGKFGNALEFDGIDDYVEVSDSSSLNFGSSDFSVSFWTKPAEFKNYQRFIHKYTSAGPMGFIVYGDINGDVYLNLCGDNDSLFNQYMGTYDTINWHHFVFVKTSNQITCYKDGVLQGSPANKTIGNIDNAINVQIGKYSSNYLSGAMDDVRIYDRALDWKEVLELAFMINYPYEEF